jgi:hypothetical protein
MWLMLRGRLGLVVLVGVVGAVLLVGCGRGEGISRNELQPLTVGEVIDGTYDVTILPDFFGVLNLRNGRYSFDLTENEPDQGVNFFFYNYPEGSYEIIRYYGQVTQNSILENLDNNEILFRLLFISGDTKKVYLIRNDKDNEEIFFHSSGDELEIWKIRKSWDL